MMKMKVILKKKISTNNYRQKDNEKKHGKKAFRLRELEQLESTKQIKDYANKQI